MLLFRMPATVCSAGCRPVGSPAWTEADGPARMDRTILYTDWIRPATAAARRESFFIMD